jgi:hypothetical protein
MEPKKLDLLIRKFYGLSVLAHTSHINTRVFAQHEALGDFYNIVNNIKDRLIEYSIGKGYIAKVDVAILEVGSDIISQALLVADQFCELAEDQDDEALCNIAGEFEESVGKLKYFFLFK